MSMYQITAWITTFITSVICVITYLSNSRKEVNKRWFLMSLSIALWSLFLGFMFGAKDAKSAFIYSKTLMMGASFIPITFYHFVLVLIEKQKEKKQRSILLFGYLIAIFVFLLNFTSLLVKSVSYKTIVRCFYPDAGYLFILYIFSYFAFFGYGCFLLFKSEKMLPMFKKNQVRYILIASGIGSVGGATTFPLWYQIQIVPFGSHFVWLYTFAISIAFLRYILMDIRVVVTRASIFAFVYVLVLGIPFMIAKVAKPYLVGAFSERWWLVILGIGMILAGIGPFIYIRLKSRAEAILLKEERKRHQDLARASRDILRFTNLDALLKAIIHSLIRIMRIKLAAIYLADEDKKVYSLKSAWQPPIKNPDLPKQVIFNSALIKMLSNRKDKPLTIDELNFYRRGSDDLEFLELKQIFESLKSQLIIPAYRTGKLMGFLCLGNKYSERGYSQEDIQVLMVLASHATLAIENAIFSGQERERQAILFHSASLASLGTMASMMGHQVNNRFQAVNNLAGFSETLELMLDSKKDFSLDERKQLIEKSITSLRRISDEATKGGETVASIRRLGKLSSEEFSPVALGEVLDVALGVLRYKIKFDEFNFNMDVLDTLPKILGDSTQLGEVFFNLIDNAYDAIKERAEANSNPDYKVEGDGLAADSQSHKLEGDGLATDSQSHKLEGDGLAADSQSHKLEGDGLASDSQSRKPELTIKAYIKRNDKHLHIEVSDTGMGIKDDFMPKLFVPFYTTKTSSGKGTGLGLHVIKRIIEFHNGKISVESKYGEGTTFKIELPIAEAREGEKANA